ncbi:MAG: class I SAM-dependent methyltransferase [Bacteroidales bacterium]|nr:class I SAM-dependent methyltransferase [Bacteroidales bacterium]
MQNLRFIKAYMNYYLRAVTKYDVHPPFLYDLITKVLNDKTYNPGYDRVESLKAKLLKDQTRINVEDYGAGSKANRSDQRSITQITRFSSKPKKYGRLLFRLVKNFKPENVLELGTSLGLSAAYMALANPDSKIITVEGSTEIAKAARHNFDDLDLKNIKPVTGQFDHVLPGLLAEIPQLDLAFIDGNHQKEPTIRYFEHCKDKSVNDTLLVFDDIHWSEGMEEAWKAIQDHPSVTLTVDLFFMGLVFLKKELTKQHFIIRY